MTIIERPWGSLLKLTLLSLNENQLRRELPSELGNLANLRSLALHENQLSGELPPELGNLANLAFLSIGNNQLSGELPTELGNLNNLTYIYHPGNQLSGCIPGVLRDRLHMELSYLGGLPFCAATTTSPPALPQASRETDRDALVALYSATNGPE